MIKIAHPDDTFSLPPGDHAEVVNLLNRLNMAFDFWDVEGMVQAFAVDAVVAHPRGDVRGRDELRAFLDDYRPLTVGVRRVQANHVIDVDHGGDVTVTSYNMLIRVARPGDAEAAAAATVYDAATGLPAIEMFSVVVDRLRRYTDLGWRIVHRDVPHTTRNPVLS
ncbi:nuclear transport factor 2 family protein [Mycolicibacterium smegmatis]|uniref:nuclear transport factor 2 family protein n=1 Tax=Mycolicibacterium smegmatis TaxID=1772 RepID=UPI001303CFC0|nr:nuclear transport factor 2 family protein [Mycolicibacterium smegmatis]